MSKDAKFTWEEINKVREATSIGMWDAREALNATGGNVEETIELINNYYYNVGPWDIRYKLMILEKRVKTLEERAETIEKLIGENN